MFKENTPFVFLEEPNTNNTNLTNRVLIVCCKKHSCNSCDSCSKRKKCGSCSREIIQPVFKNEFVFKGVRRYGYKDKVVTK